MWFMDDWPTHFAVTINYMLGIVVCLEWEKRGERVEERKCRKTEKYYRIVIIFKGCFSQMMWCQSLCVFVINDYQNTQDKKKSKEKKKGRKKLVVQEAKEICYCMTLSEKYYRPCTPTWALTFINLFKKKKKKKITDVWIHTRANIFARTIVKKEWKWK